MIEGNHIPPVAFTQSEANALIIAKKLVSKNKDVSFVQDTGKQVSSEDGYKKTTPSSNYPMLTSKQNLKSWIGWETGITLF